MISKKIGIIGGGQLGKMLLQSALDLDLNVSIIDPDPQCSCNSLVENFTQGDIKDFDDVYNFGKNLDLLTIEIENVNIEALKKLESEGKKVFPQPHIIENIKNKKDQKRFFINNNIPTADYLEVNNLNEIRENSSFLPAVNKVAVGGYDGKGVQVIKNESDIAKGFDEPGILEKLINFKKELAVIVARNERGEAKAFSPVEMVFHPEANLVEYLFAPADVSNEINSKIVNIALKTAEAYGIVGLLAVEMFLTENDEILVNEVAPRPHNSGHHTQKANLISQFDQHWRAILNLPLGNTDQLILAAMVNLLGEPDYTGPVKYQGLEKILEINNIFPFFYGKKTTKPFRKMGHVTILDADFDKLKEKVNFVQNNLKVISE